MSHPRIAVSGVVRAWDGGDRTGVNAAYVRALLIAGGVPLILSPLMGGSLAGSALDGCDGLLLTGGEDIDPSWYGAPPSPLLSPPSRERDLFELALFAVARQRGLPILGVCRGIQLINVALGGTLFQDLPSERPGRVEHRPQGARDARSHVVRFQPGSRAARALGASSVTVNSSHHQAIKDLAPGLIASGWTGDDLIEAVESEPDAFWMLAVQWHPEEMHADREAPEQGLFQALVNEAGLARSGLVGGRRKEDAIAHAIERTS
ncbi:MAG TPA: gamma-glutamyl-gamma-aminobutyrate hydrolase family protein [Gemmatimonadales bacterium]|nr:gamma-glutamyl-gamma-aminobutyrate hydrolase family protein [Gemmatimonadales bacterium]